MSTLGVVWGPREGTTIAAATATTTARPAPVAAFSRDAVTAPLGRATTRRGAERIVRSRLSAASRHLLDRCGFTLHVERVTVPTWISGLDADVDMWRYAIAK